MNKENQKSVVSDKLLDALNAISAKMNRVSAAEFDHFAVLYHENNGLTKEEVSELSAEFNARFDPYENITIIGDDGKELITLPRLFNETRPIDNRFSSAKNNFRKNASADAPKLQADAVGGIVDSFRASAQEPKYLDEVQQRRADFRRVDAEFKATRNKTVVDADAVEDAVEDELTPSVSTQFDWEIK